MSISSNLSSIIDSAVQGWNEGRAEQIKRNTPLSYWCKLFENLNYSPNDFYAMVEKNLDDRDVPDLLRDNILLHEGTFLSKRRLYLQMRRERIVFEICAAPFGTGFFISSRLFDRRREAKFVDYCVAFLCLTGISAYFLQSFGGIPSIVVFGLLFTTAWSLMRLAVIESMARLDELVTKIPCFGPIYESLFHPNTYFRQDSQNMFRESVHDVVLKSVGEIAAEKGIKPLTELESRPQVADLHRR